VRRGPLWGMVRVPRQRRAPRENGGGVKRLTVLPFRGARGGDERDRPAGLSFSLYELRSSSGRVGRQLSDQSLLLKTNAGRLCGRSFSSGLGASTTPPLAGALIRSPLAG